MFVLRVETKTLKIWKEIRMCKQLEEDSAFCRASFTETKTKILKMTQRPVE